MEKKQNIFGRHFIVEYAGCDAETIKWKDPVAKIMLAAAQLSKVTILQQSFHQYEPFGVSGFIFIAESHLSLHTWPEKRYAAFDILTCGDQMKPEAAIDQLGRALKAENVNILEILRGF